jgi:hypothetical protein
VQAGQSGTSPDESDRHSTRSDPIGVLQLAQRSARSRDSSGASTQPTLARSDRRRNAAPGMRPDAASRASSSDESIPVEATQPLIALDDTSRRDDVTGLSVPARPVCRGRRSLVRKEPSNSNRPLSKTDGVPDAAAQRQAQADSRRREALNPRSRLRWMSHGSDPSEG